jgi:rhomboid protease GluP
LNPQSQTGASDASVLQDAAVEASMQTIAELEAREAARRERHQTALWNYPATYALIGINLAVYLVMFRYGPVPAMVHAGSFGGILTAQFDVDTLVRFGATASPNIHQGEWWRLVTGTFVHVTLLHILLNMWCLWNLGLFGEPLLGKRGLVAVYLLTGTAGMVLSYSVTVWHNFNIPVQYQQPGYVAGASGAVFGIAGILIVLLSNRGLKVPWEELRKLRQQVILFAGINLVLGMAPNLIARAASEQVSGYLPHIDNSAHVGGFASGLLLGWPLFAKMTSGKASYRHRQRVTYAAATLLLCLYAYALAKFV